MGYDKALQLGETRTQFLYCCSIDSPFSAEKSLSYAFRNCPTECATNKRLVLIYLIPVKVGISQYRI